MSKTSGGLIKFSVALSEEMVATLDRLASERSQGSRRSDVLREALELGLPVYEAHQTVRRTIQRQAASRDGEPEQVAV